MKRINIYLTTSQIGDLLKLSQEKGLTMSEHIRRAVDFYLALCDVSKEEKRGPRAIWNVTEMTDLPFSEPPPVEDDHPDEDGGP